MSSKLNVEEITRKFSYNFGETYDVLNIVPISRPDALKTFQEHDEVIRLDDKSDNGPMFCSKFFKDYYILAEGIVNATNRTITIVSAKKIPMKFINTLPSKDFVTIVDSFYNKIKPDSLNAGQTVFKRTVNDPITNKEILSVAMANVVDHQKYLDFQKQYQ